MNSSNMFLEMNDIDRIEEIVAALPNAGEEEAIEHLKDIHSSLSSFGGFVEIGGWRAVAKTMQVHSNSAAVQDRAIELLTDIVKDGAVDSDVAVLLVNASLAAMKNFPHDGDVRYQSVEALKASRDFDEGLVTTDVLLDAKELSYKNFQDDLGILSIATRFLFLYTYGVLLQALALASFFVQLLLVYLPSSRK
jgi:hypothetical protein